MKRIIFPFLLSIKLSIIFAQQNNFEVKGVIIDQSSEQPIPFATVLVVDKSTSQPITGVTTADDGSFSIIASSKEIFIEISFIGYQTTRREDIQINGQKVDLGKIALSEQSQMLNEVEVRGERSTTEFRLDKRVFNVGKDLSSTGANALEVLDNVPSVTVSIEGQVSLRGNSGVQILINGKPSVLTSEGGNALGSITAEMIEKVEVITNPSAKYEAEGTAGIINIVIKKERGLTVLFLLIMGNPRTTVLG